MKKKEITLGVLNITAATVSVAVSSLLIINSIEYLKKKDNSKK